MFSRFNQTGSFFRPSLRGLTLSLGLLAALILLAGCISDEELGAPPADTKTTTPIAADRSTLVATSVIPVGDATCPTGGHVIHTGFDDNGNGSLDAAEYDKNNEYTVCNGTNGATGANGADGTNGTNGTNGSPGTNGTNGINSIATVTAIAVGNATCNNGGQQIDIWVDSNSDGLKGSGEVTSYTLCNGATGLNQGLPSPGAPYDPFANTLGTIGAKGTSYYSFSAFTDGAGGINYNGPYTVTLMGLESDLAMARYTDNTFATQSGTQPTCSSNNLFSYKRCQTASLTEGSPYFFTLKENYVVPNQFWFDISFGVDESGVNLGNPGSGATPLPFTNAGHSVSSATYFGPSSSTYSAQYFGGNGLQSVSLKNMVSLPGTNPKLSFNFRDVNNKSALGIDQNTGTTINKCNQGANTTGFGCVVFLDTFMPYSMAVENGGSGVRYDFVVEAGDTITPAVPAGGFNLPAWGETMFKYTPAGSGVFKITYDMPAGITDGRYIYMNLFNKHPNDPTFTWSNNPSSCWNYYSTAANKCILETPLSNAANNYLYVYQGGNTAVTGATVAAQTVTTTALTVNGAALTGQAMAASGSTWFSFTTSTTANATAKVTVTTMPTGMTYTYAGVYIYNQAGSNMGGSVYGAWSTTTIVGPSVPQLPAGTYYLRVADSYGYGAFTYSVQVTSP